MSRRRWALVLAAAAAAAGAPQMMQDLSEAESNSKVHFTVTLDSAPDPGAGETGQLAMVLRPEKGAVFDGSLTFAASLPVWVEVLHEIEPGEARGQPIWTVDGKSFYALTRMYGGPSGQAEFTGAAVALHSSSTFTATASVDAWLRDGQFDAEKYSFDIDLDPPALRLYEERVQVSVPLRAAIYEEEEASYIITDSGDEEFAKEAPGADWPVLHAPPLAEAGGAALYAFTDGIDGDGMYGFQPDVLTTSPGEPGYTQLAELAKVSWKPGQRASTLLSEKEVLEAEDGGRVEVERTGVVLNAPQITWPGGSMEGEQVSEIGEEAAVFVAHRAWGSDGRAVYYILTGAVPARPAELMGVPHSPGLDYESSAGLYQFRDGLAGPGTLGFQPDVLDSVPGDEGYSPVRSVSVAEWNGEAVLLQTVRNIESAEAGGQVSVTKARALGEDHVINAPIVDPSGQDTYSDGE